MCKNTDNIRLSKYTGGKKKKKNSCSIDVRSNDYARCCRVQRQFWQRRERGRKQQRNDHYIDGESVWVYDAEMELGKQFEEEPGIKVDYQIVPSDKYYNMLMTKLNSGEELDIFGDQAGSFDIVSQYNVVENAVDLSDQV